MKKLFPVAAVLATLAFSATAFAYVTVSYYNKDSRKWSFDATCSGSRYTVVFDESRTSSTTIEGSGPCTLKTPAGDVSLKDGDKIEIKDGKITIK